MKKYVQVFVCFLVGVLPIFGQTPFQKTMVNQGTLTISPEAVVSTSYDFDNTASGIVKNDGTTYYYSDFNNDNLYYHNEQSPTAQAIFTPLEVNQGYQQISGASPSDFYDVILNNPTSIMGFDLQNEMNIKGSLDFQDGIMQVDSLKGMLTFYPGAKALNPVDKSHAEGYVDKIGKDNFTYPIGDKGVYRYAKISSVPNEKNAYQSKYILNDHEFFRQHNETDNTIKILNTKEYWKVEKSNNVKGDILLTLSWDNRTTSPDVLGDSTSNLHIVRWDENRKIWEDQGGIVSSELKEVTTAISIKNYGYFTLAKILNPLSQDVDIEIFNFVTVNADSKNDHFLIKNIENYPKNKVEIYNRWGVKVFETEQYNNSDNAFRGYSNGRVTFKKGEKLPTGTYFYILTYENLGAKESVVVKKSGYLHLETE